MTLQTLYRAAGRLIGIHPVLPIIRCEPRASQEWSNKSGPLHRQAVARLNHLHAMGVHLREQLEAAEEECCLILGCDPESDCAESEWAKEIVAFGVPVNLAVHRIEKSRECE